MSGPQSAANDILVSWRAIIVFGLNTAAYKIALGRSYNHQDSPPLECADAHRAFTGLLVMTGNTYVPSMEQSNAKSTEQYR